MPTGKLAAQAGHAFTDAAHECLLRRPDRYHAYHDGEGGSKSTVEARNLHQLERARRECEDAELPYALVVDSGHVLLPHFTGERIVTALGIGPCTRAQCRHIVKRFRSVR